MDIDNDISGEQLKAAVLRKFLRMHAGVKRHIYETDVPKGFPSHIHKRIMKCCEELYRKGLMKKFPHGKENVWQLNINRISEIKELILKYYPIESM